ncbi:aminotransferase class I/II-fold pyridoxal phosphate-dependent enzyme [Polluticoccus soli]|uniref:aminotransferase class I/II-fold pyridoxal phosphate-dependent enzyme n=1 Tax=Polluticoccus soli TaxID=3034150 RepID=UPI0023E1BF0C|nr:aminotransferase class I/II-fold pyridoxal phosphate-dependent enzyme [Flavipsychrobacter sp. JY13-12]
MKPKIWLSAPHMGGNEQHYVNEAFDSNWVAPLGPNVDGLEQNIAHYLRENTSVAALSSGTAAIHLALVMLGVQPGDEVICQSMTFSASANPIAYLGATPIFIDSEPETWNMSPVHLEAAIKDRLSNGKKPKAIIPVHLYGMPAHMQAIMEIAERYDIPVLEDAAEALGSAIDGVKCGTFGVMSVLSFNGNKIITTSGGGALVAKEAKYTEKARFLSTQARDAAPHYQHSQIGYNYRMSNICAGIGRGQMEVLLERVAQRRAIFDKYEQRYSGHPGVSFLKEPEGYSSNRWLTTILIDPQQAGINRETLRLALENDNIESRPLWKPMHLQPVFANCPFYGDDCAEKLFENGLCLPSTSSLTDSDIERIFSVMDSVFQHELTIVGGR